MKIILSLDENNEKAKAFLDFIKTLDFLSFEKEADLPQWQKNQLDIYLDQHNKGTAEYSDWDTEKQRLFRKFNA